MTREMYSPELLRRMFNYDEDTGVLYWKPRPREWFATQKAFSTWHTRFSGKPAFTKMSNGYLGGKIMGVHHYAHRVAYAVATGESLVGHIDHINGDRSDNRISNLRQVTQAENSKNIRIPGKNTTGFLGVTKRGNRFIAQAKLNQRVYYLGLYKTAEEAAAARQVFNHQNGFHENHGRRA